MERALLREVVISGRETQPGRGGPGREPGEETPPPSFPPSPFQASFQVRGKSTW